MKQYIDDDVWAFYNAFRALSWKGNFHVDDKLTININKNLTKVKPYFNPTILRIEEHFVCMEDTNARDSWIFLVRFKRKKNPCQYMTYFELEREDPSRLAYYAWRRNLPMYDDIWDWTISKSFFPLPKVTKEDIEKDKVNPSPWFSKNRTENFQTYILITRGEQGGLLNEPPSDLGQYLPIEDDEN